MSEEKIFSYEPVADSACRLLILGTMPSVKSLEAGFYYAHPRNAFWPMMAEILEAPLPGSVAEKKRLLLGRRIALWDVARSCVRKGSLDADMRQIELNDFEWFFERYPGIEKVLLNGGTAWKLYHRLPESMIFARPCFLMPSTSPAYTLPYARKLEAWRAAIME